MTTPRIEVNPTDPTDPTYEQLWRIRDVATFLSLAPSAVYRARREHGLPTVRIGGTLRFRPTSVRAWAAERESSMGPPLQQIDRTLAADPSPVSICPRSSFFGNPALVELGHEPRVPAGHERPGFCGASRAWVCHSISLRS